jgi:glutathione S-transferase
VTGSRPLLIGYGPSVYTRAVRMAAAHHGLSHDWQEQDPFEAPVAAHPFGRVPVWRDGSVAIYETAAILTYLEAQAGDFITDPVRAARVQQVAGIVDAYVYWPLVRQVYAHAVFRPKHGDVGDRSQIDAGMRAAPNILAALEALAQERHVLTGSEVTRADWHLAPMIAAFAAYPPAMALLAEYPALTRWFETIRQMPAFQTTEEIPT